MPYGQLQVDTVKDSLNNTFSPASSVFKNRIINGEFKISQYNGSSSVTINSGGAYIIDRWQAIATQGSKLAAQQNYSSVTPPTGYINYLGFQSLSAYSVLAADYFGIRQQIEGLNVTDLAWGTANAKTVTLSFWVYSSLTGTFGGSFGNSALNRTYPFTYSIPVASTWTQISITVAGDTSGTWLTTNGIGIGINFSLATGTISSGTAGSWSSNSYLSATGATSVVGTSGATFYITGVQLEVGTNATNFEYRDYGRELILCQRYYYSENMYLGGYTSTGVGNTYYKTTLVPMRTTPTYTAVGTTNTNVTGSTITPISYYLISLTSVGVAAGGFISNSTGNLNAEL